MHLPMPEAPLDTPAQRKADRARWLRAFNLSFATVLVLLAIFAAQSGFDVAPWTVRPGVWAGLIGVITAPLLHGSFDHLVSNAFGVLLLGTLAGAMYPKALLRTLVLAWIGSGLAAWLLGDAGSHHLGASGVTHGLMFLLVGQGLLRRDRPSVAAAMIAFLLFGGMLLTVLPREMGVSWQSHLGGAVGGVIGALAFFRADPLAPRRRYSYEDDEDAIASIDDELETPAPADVPVLWHRAEPREERGVVLRFPPRPGD